MKLFCDLDGVLVLQTGRDGFDAMPWTADGKELWQFIAPMSPTILSQLPDEIFDHCAPQKKAWCARELGADVPVFVTPKQIGKTPWARRAGAILIDDDARTHGYAWTLAGGVFIHHTSARDTIERLKELAP